MRLSSLLRSARRLRPLLLALVLVGAQQAGIVHLTAHAAQRLREAPAPAQSIDHDCAQCAQFAALGAAPLAALPAFLPPSVIASRSVALPLPPADGRPPAAYRSRAPPLPA